MTRHLVSSDMAPDEFDRLLAAWMDADAPNREPEGLLQATLERTSRTRRRPSWLLPGRWIPMQLTTRLQPVPRMAGLLLILALIVALAAAAVLIASRRPALPPFGPAENGRIAFVSEGDIFTANPDGTHPVAITSGPDIDARPIWSHVGSKVAFFRSPSVAATSADLLVLDVDAGTLETLVEDAASLSVPSWSPDDRWLTFSHGLAPQVYVAPADGSTEARSLELGGPASAPIFSPDGRRLAYTAPTTGGQALFVVNLDGTGRAQLSTAFPSFSHGFGHGSIALAWSPDGSRLLFSAGDGETGEFDLYVVPNDGETQERRVTAEPGSEYGATWSPDGTRIAYLASAPFDHPNLMVANSDGSGARRLIDQTVFWLTPQWSPDGRMITVHANVAEEPPIWLVDSETGTVRAKLDTTPAAGSDDDTPGSADVWSCERVLP
jgi:Tol biopolymer transport system component